MTQFHEYPKAVYPNGEFVVVHDGDHEMRVMGASTKPVAGVESEKADLIAQAESLGIEVDRRWGLTRLKSEIEAKSG